MSEAVTISSHFIGPPDSGNGGYACGLVAGAFGDVPVEATLRLPPPIGRPLRFERTSDHSMLFDGDQLVAEARPADLVVDLPARVSLDDAQRAADAFDLDTYAARHHYPGCFTCGPQRDAGDGLRIFPAAVAPGVVAWPWTPDASLVDADGLVDRVLIWAVLDCPSGMAWFHEQPPVTPHVLGRMTAAIHRRPAAGEALVVTGWIIGTDGRKRRSGSVVWSAGGEVLAENLAIWIELTDEQRGAFSAAGDAAGLSHPPVMLRSMNGPAFDLTEHLDELRTHSTEWLRAEREEAVREQRQWRVRELALTRVLDERGAASVDVVGKGTTVREARETVEVSRALADLPEIAAAAHSGELSWSQLKPLVEVATPETDREWAQRGKGFDPIDLARLARQQKVVTAADAAARREAREFRWWWQRDTGMLSVRGESPDVDGALVKSVFEHLVERMRPPKGQPWESLAHRAADVLVAVCSSYADAVPTGRSRPQIVVQHRVDHVPEVDGIPIAAETLDALRGEAVFEDEFVDDGSLVSRVRSGRAIPASVLRFLEGRDPHCRVPGCEQTRRLHSHHLVPSSWGGSDEADNLARVCQYHHGLLIPNGPYALIGDPSRPDGLRLVAREQAGREQADLVGARAGPGP